MTSNNEVATWNELQNTLEGRLNTLNVPAAEEYAKDLVNELRAIGWRAPTPKRPRPDKNNRPRPNRTEASKRHIAACRAAIRAAASNA